MSLVVPLSLNIVNHSHLAFFGACALPHRVESIILIKKCCSWIFTSKLHYFWQCAGRYSSHWSWIIRVYLCWLVGHRFGDVDVSNLYRTDFGSGNCTELWFRTTYRILMIFFSLVLKHFSRGCRMDEISAVLQLSFDSLFLLQRTPVSSYFNQMSNTLAVSCEFLLIL